MMLGNVFTNLLMGLLTYVATSYLGILNPILPTLCVLALSFLIDFMMSKEGYFESH